MGIHERLDAVGSASNGCLIFLLLLLLVSGHAHSQPRAAVPDKIQQVKKMYDAGRWSDVVRAVPDAPGQAAALDLYRGLALAQLGHLGQAETQLKDGFARHRHDARFPAELAGIAYRERRFSEAKIDLLRSLALDPGDRYANDFLASIYFLEGNLEAALKYWNRAGKPKLNDLTYNVGTGLDPLILDKSFSFSPGAEWRRDQFLTTKAELEGLDLFPSMRFDLQARPDGSFDLSFDASQSSGWGGAKLANFATLLRGLPYQSVYPEFYNINHKGLNWLSFVRWDDEKRRLSSELAWPPGGNPHRRLRIYFDGRNENWNITRTLIPAAPSPAGLNVERAVAGTEIQSIPSWRWQWNVGAEYSYRRFRALTNIPAAAAPFFTDASGLALRVSGQHALLRVPERRFTLDSGAAAELGKFYAKPLGRYGRVEASLAANWFPEARGDDYQTRTMLRAGRTFGKIPFDDLFMLGFDRDNDLWMRGHDGLVNGKKGNAPLGSNFVLSNSDFDKVVYHDALFTLKLGPFLDTGDIDDPSEFFGSPRWLSDTGVQAEVGLLGRFSFLLGYGRDLRSGASTFYTTVSQ